MTTVKDDRQENGWIEVWAIFKSFWLISPPRKAFLLSLQDGVCWNYETTNGSCKLTWLVTSRSVWRRQKIGLTCFRDWIQETGKFRNAFWNSVESCILVSSCPYLGRFKCNWTFVKAVKEQSAMEGHFSMQCTLPPHDFGKSLLCSKILRLRPLVLRIKVELKWRWLCSNDGMVLRGSEDSEKKPDS